MLSHPLIVEAAEELFVPACVFNNADGADAAALARFDEPAWNNPVVRVVDARGADRVPRNGEGWTVGAVATQMAAALAERGSTVPRWLDLVAWSARRGAGAETAVFGMT